VNNASHLQFDIFGNPMPLSPKTVGLLRVNCIMSVNQARLPLLAKLCPSITHYCRFQQNYIRKFDSLDSKITSADQM
jgi:hypothetical protein